MTTSAVQKKSTRKGSLLSSREYTACNKLSLLEDSHGLHARALLALDKGMTQPQVAENTGLTLGQVRYWLARFRKERMGIFPATLRSTSKKQEIPASVKASVTEDVLQKPDENSSEEIISPEKEPKKIDGSSGEKKKKIKKSSGESKKVKDDSSKKSSGKDKLKKEDSSKKSKKAIKNKKGKSKN